MKKIYLLAIAAVCASFSAVASEPLPSKINAAGIELLNQYKKGELSLDNPVLLAPASRGGAPMVRVTVQADASVTDSLAAEGYAVQHLAANFYIVTMPVDEIEALSASDSVEALSFGNIAEPSMNLARVAGAVNTCVTDIRLPHPFKGSGVIVGAFDTGFDPRHINFMNADGTATRLIYYANYNTGTGTPRVLTGQETINGSTDNREESHATHVVGIAAGAYNGAGFTYSGNTKGYYSGAAGGSAGTDLGSIPYYGVAPEADIAVCAGSLSTGNILSGIGAMIDYAKSQGKPIVINLSLGSNYGPHDGTETEIQALNALAEKAIICISSGNEGDKHIYAGKDITDAAGGSFSVMLTGNFSGVVDCWSSETLSFSVAVQIVNKTTGEVVAESAPSSNGSMTVNGSTEGFSNYTTGSVSLTSSLDGRNLRYNVRVSGSLAMKNTYSSTHAFVLKIKTTSAAKIDVYGNANCGFSGFPYEGYVEPDDNGSINGMACGKNTVCVGSFNTRQWWFTTNGTGYFFSGSSSTDGTISSFSSYGTLADGRNLPDFCAPGSAIISSYSSEYVSAQGNDVLSSLTGYTGKGVDTYYWGVMQGTSMACPYATGTVALWLESNPDLTAAQIREIVKATATKPSVPSVAWGDGKINAFKGLQTVIKSYPAGISGVTVGNDDIIVTGTDTGCEVFAAGATALSVELYSVNGMLVARTAATGDTAVLTTAGLAKGVYILRATAGPNRTATKKIVI